MIPVLLIAKKCFWKNCYMFAVSILLSILTLLILYFCFIILELSQDKKHGQHYVDAWIVGLLVVVFYLWTHAIMQSLSNFLFQAFAIHWYFNAEQDYSCCGKGLLPSVKLLCRHIGTVTIASIVEFVP